MPVPLSSETVSQRLRDFPREGYLYIGSFMKSVVLAAATFVLLEILVDLRNAWPRLLPWLAALLGVLVTHTTWGRGALLSNSRANVWDDALPLLLGIIEFCLFAVLAPREAHPDVWRWWLIVVGFHALLGACLAHNRIAITRPKEDFAAELQPLANEYLTWCRQTRQQAAMGATLAFMLGILALALLPRWLDRGGCYALAYWILVLPFLLIFGHVIWRAEEHRQHIDQVIFGGSAPRGEVDG